MTERATLPAVVLEMLASLGSVSLIDRAPERFRGTART